MAFRNYLEGEDDKPYFHLNSLAHYYEEMQRYAALIKEMTGYIKDYGNELGLTKEEIDARLTAYILQNKAQLDQRLGEWDEKLQQFDGSVTELLAEWVDDGTLNHIIDTTLIEQKIAPLAGQLVETKEELRDNVYVQNKFKKPVVTIIDDDGYTAAWTVLKPMIQSRNLVADVAMVTSLLDTSGRLTSKQLLQMYDEGFGVLSHSHTHPNLATLSEPDLDNEMRLSYEKLKSLGIDPPAIVYPLNGSSRLVADYTKRYYQVGIGKLYEANENLNLPPVRSAELTRRSLGWGSGNAVEGDTSLTETSVEHGKWQIDQAIEKGGWLIFMSHSAQANADDNNRMGQVLDYLKQKKDAGLVDVLVTKDALKRFGNKYDDGNYYRMSTADEADGKVPFNIVGTDGYRYSGTEIVTYKGDPGAGSNPTNNLPLSSYKKGKTLTTFSESHQTGLPGAGGTLETFYYREDSRSHQYWHSANGNIYKRRWISGAWGEFVQLTNVGGGTGGTGGTNNIINIPRLQQSPPAIPPGGDVTIVMDVPGTLNTSTVVMSPYTPLNAGFIWTSGVQEPGKVFLRITNLRTVEAAPGQRSWAGKVFN